MAIKFSNNAPERKRISASSGSINIAQKYGNVSKYVQSSTASTPISKSAQMQSGGMANAMWGQPMFFSPLHTPQNWQIASKRREIYQWSFILPCDITSKDGSLIAIDEIHRKSDPIDTNIGIPNNTFRLQDGFGNICIPDRSSKRYKKTLANRIAVIGECEELIVTHEHKCRIIKMGDMKCSHSQWSNKNCDGSYYDICKTSNCQKFHNLNEIVSTVKASEVKRGDYVLIPFNMEIEESDIRSEEDARNIAKELNNIFNDDTVNSLSMSSVLLINKIKTKYIMGYGKSKKLSSQITLLNPELQKYILYELIENHSYYNEKTNNLEMKVFSKNIANQIMMMFYRCNILPEITKSRKNILDSKENSFKYTIILPSSEAKKIKDFIPNKVSNMKKRGRKNDRRFFYKNFVISVVTYNRSFEYEGYVYDVRLPSTFTVTANKISCHQSRFFYENEPKVSAGIDFYCLDGSTPILMANGEQKPISSIREGDLVRSHDGSSNEVLEVHSRHTKEDMLAVKIDGVNQDTLKITKGHTVFIMKDEKILEIQAGSLKKGDYLLSPCLYEENYSSNIYINNDLAWLIGVYSAKGSGIPHEHVSKKGRPEGHYKGVHFTLSKDESETFAVEIIKRIEKIYGKNKTTIRVIPEKGITVVSCYGKDISDDLCGYCPEIAKDGTKGFSPSIMRLNSESLKYILSGFLQGDGCFNKNNGFQGVGVSKKLCEQIANICDILGLEYSFHKQRISSENRQTCYNIRISRRVCDIFNGINDKIYKYEINEKYINNTPYKVYKKYMLRKIITISEYQYSGKVYDLTIENSHSYIANRVAVHNSTFPMNGFKLECKSRKVLKYFEKLVKRIKLHHWLRLISFEYHLLGDVFPFIEYHCTHCSGSGVLPNGEECSHPNGTIKRIVILNPDWIAVNSSPLSSEPVYTLQPDEELKGLITQKKPIETYKRLPKSLIDLVMSGKPIQLSNRCISHIKHQGSPYGSYGTSMVRRLFTYLAYKTKLMTANWIVAERMILPIRIIKIGDKDRPADQNAIQDVTAQITAVSNDPNLTLVTHHAFEMDWVGACYSDDTEILTNEGWKLFEDLNRNEEVATYNMESGMLEYQAPTEYHEYDFESNNNLKMKHFKAKSVDVLVTPNHRMLVIRNGKLKVVYSQHVKHDDRFISTLDWKGNIPKNLPYKQKKEIESLDLNDFLKFVGYYVSEENIKVNKEKNKTKKIRGYSVAKCNNKYYNIKNDSVCSLFTIDNIEITKYIAQECGIDYKNKKIPSWIKNLPKENLQILLDAMMNRNGTIEKNKSSDRYIYNTTSNQLANDVSEIALKLGYFSHKCLENNNIYRVHWSEKRKNTSYNIKKQHIIDENYSGKVYCVKVPNTMLVTRRNGLISIQGNTGRIHNITQEMELIGKEILDGLMLNQAILNGEMGSFSSAQIGVEVMIRRLDNWRDSLAEWVENHIFLPVAMMQDFEDEEESKKSGEKEYIVPTLKWNDMNLRDKTSKLQSYMQLHDKGTISTRTLLEEFDLDYDQEVRKIREEKAFASATGQIMGQPQGGGGGAPGGLGGGLDLGGGGGAPIGGLDMGGFGGGMPGGDMGGGAAPPTGGEVGGGAPMGGGSLAGGGVAAAAQQLSPTPNFIGKRGDKKNIKKEQEKAIQPAPMKQIQLTSLELKMLKMLKGMSDRVPYPLYGQFNANVPGQPYPFLIDFAYPDIGVGLEADGQKWHSDLESKARDQKRDQKLASIGWRILRFNEDAIEDQINDVEKIVYENIVEAAKEKASRNKKAESDDKIRKIACIINNPEEILNIQKENIVVNRISMENDLGFIYLIGITDNE